MKLFDDEPSITVDGQPLSKPQAMTVRCALQSFAMRLQAPDSLGGDEHGTFMRTAYLQSIREINGMMRCYAYANWSGTALPAAPGKPVKRPLLPNLLTPRVIGEILRGEVRDWTLGDWYASLIRFPIRDATTIAVRAILDWTGGLGRAVAIEVLIRRSSAKATAIGADVFCVYHDCDVLECPPGEHDDD